MKIRDYRPEDCAQMAQLFYETVHAVNARDYTAEQLDAWAAGRVDLDAWHVRYTSSMTCIAEENGTMLGFANMEKNGYLDMLFVHKDWQGRGVATALCSALERHVPAERFTTHASITARPFFEKRGYRTVKEQCVDCRGVWMTNFVMEKNVPMLDVLRWSEMELMERTAAFAQLKAMGFLPGRGDWAALRREMDASRPDELPQFLFGFAEGVPAAYLFLIAEREAYCAALPWWAIHNADELPARQAVVLLDRGIECCRACGANVLAGRLEGMRP